MHAYEDYFCLWEWQKKKCFFLLQFTFLQKVSMGNGKGSDDDNMVLMICWPGRNRAQGQRRERFYPCPVAKNHCRRPTAAKKFTANTMIEDRGRRRRHNWRPDQPKHKEDEELFLIVKVEHCLGEIRAKQFIFYFLWGTFLISSEAHFREA